MLKHSRSSTYCFGSSVGMKNNLHSRGWKKSPINSTHQRFSTHLKILSNGRLLHFTNTEQGNDIYVLGITNERHNDIELNNTTKTLIEKVRPHSIVLDVPESRMDKLLTCRRERKFPFPKQLEVATDIAIQRSIPLVVGGVDMNFVAIARELTFKTFLSFLATPNKTVLFQHYTLHDNGWREKVREFNTWLGAVSPKIYDICVHQVDVNIVSALKACRGTTLGIVGLMHLDGIEQNWDTVKAAPVIKRKLFDAYSPSFFSV